MKLSGIDISEAVRCLLERTRLAQVTREAFSVFGLFLSSVRHVSGDVHQTDDGRVRAGFRDYGSAVAVSYKNAWAVLLSNDTLRSRHVFLKGRLRLLDDADVVAILDENVVNAFPAGTICPGAVDQNNIPNAMRIVLRGERAA